MMMVRPISADHRGDHHEMPCNPTHVCGLHSPALRGTCFVSRGKRLFDFCGQRDRVGTTSLASHVQYLDYPYNPQKRAICALWVVHMHRLVNCQIALFLMSDKQQIWLPNPEISKADAKCMMEMIYELSRIVDKGYPSPKTKRIFNLADKRKKEL